MADVVEEAATNVSSATMTIRTEEFVNKFRVGFTDDVGRAVEWTIQKGQPVLYNSDAAFGLTTIKEISKIGFFTVYLAPHVKNECCYAQKYINTIDLNRVRTLLAAGRVPHPGLPLAILGRFAGRL